MTDWVLVPCLVTLRSEFNAIAPNRDKASDGSIGNTAHQQTVSDHNADEVGRVPIHDADRKNEVHAIDVDADLKRAGLTMERVVQFLLGRCRSGAEKRLRYIIFNRRIWEASNDWRQRTYTGASPHTEHAHFSASYETAREASTASWHLADILKETRMTTLDAADHTAIRTDVATIVDDRATVKAYTDGAGGSGSVIGRAVINSGYPIRPGEDRTPLWDNLQQLQVQQDAIAANVQACKDMLLQMLQDPSEPGHPIVEAVRYAIANP